MKKSLLLAVLLVSVSVFAMQNANGPLAVGGQCLTQYHQHKTAYEKQNAGKRYEQTPQYQARRAVCCKQIAAAGSASNIDPVLKSALAQYCPAQASS